MPEPILVRTPTYYRDVLTNARGCALELGEIVVASQILTIGDSSAEKGSGLDSCAVCLRRATAFDSLVVKLRSLAYRGKGLSR